MTRKKQSKNKTAYAVLFFYRYKILNVVPSCPLIYTNYMNWNIVGLGNPGSEYKNTRHNTGFLVLDYLRERWLCTDWKKKIFSNASVSQSETDGNQITLIKPETFMNLSGRAVIKYVKTKDDLSRLVVVQDDVHLPIGTFKFSFGRGDGGHNGITSLHQALKSKDFIRLRVGVAPQTATDNQGYKIKLDDFVLGKFTAEEKLLLNKQMPQILEAFNLLFTKGLSETMEKYNK